ncbi:metal-binding protein [Pokkaliibacter plantistimulans]|uniref:Metal-binding protein n=2 Tax=Pseudomonadota TaxID=1224 RepID=A0A2S5KHK8_9PROT|nr:metal-binding protein [Pokkaliibacter plantistimulans]
MGGYSQNLTKRNSGLKIINGYCLICGEYKKLTEDHVPPKGAIVVTKVEQKLISESMGQGKEKIKGVLSRNGSKFKTICKDCNSYLGGSDSEISRLYKEVTPVISKYFSTATDIFSIKKFNLDALKYMRAMIGHILSATTVEECHIPQRETPYFTPLKKFVLGDEQALDDTHDVYYWFYPYRAHLSAKMVAFYHNGQMCILSLLSFFPIAFLIMEKNKGIVPEHANRLDRNSDSLILDLSTKYWDYVSFPFVSLKGNQFYAIQNDNCIISYPIKG